MTSSAPDPRPVLRSPRLVGEPVLPRHAAPMQHLLDDPELWRYMADEPPTLARLERQYGFLAGGRSPDGQEHWLTWILVPAAGGAPLGFVQATIREPETATIAYVLGRAHWRQGYAREAIAALLDAVFAGYRVERAVAEMDTRNEASRRLVESLGFRHARTVTGVAVFKGASSDEHVYELPRAAWRAE